jgi:hypothetical protein
MWISVIRVVSRGYIRYKRKKGLGRHEAGRNKKLAYRSYENHNKSYRELPLPFVNSSEL